MRRDDAACAVLSMDDEQHVAVVHTPEPVRGCRELAVLPPNAAAFLMNAKGLMNTDTALELLNRSLEDLCLDLNRERFFPLLEADIAAYLYHQLLENGCPLNRLFLETRVCGVEDERRRKYDLVMGEVQLESACVDPVLVAEIKCFQRWGHTPSQHRHRFRGILENDLESLGEASQVLPEGRFEIVVDLVSSPLSHGYLTGELPRPRETKGTDVSVPGSWRIVALGAAQPHGRSRGPTALLSPECAADSYAPARRSPVRNLAGQRLLPYRYLGTYATVRGCESVFPCMGASGERERRS